MWAGWCNNWSAGPELLGVHLAVRWRPAHCRDKLIFSCDLAMSPTLAIAGGEPEVEPSVKSALDGGRDKKGGTQIIKIEGACVFHSETHFMHCVPPRISSHRCPKPAGTHSAFPPPPHMEWPQMQGGLNLAQFLHRSDLIYHPRFPSPLTSRVCSLSP